MFFNLKNDPSMDEQWGNTVYFKKSYDIIKQLECRINRSVDIPIVL